jgi:hypothetical protein
MKRISTLLSLMLLAAVLFISCGKDPESGNPDTEEFIRYKLDNVSFELPVHSAEFNGQYTAVIGVHPDPAKTKDVYFYLNFKGAAAPGAYPAYPCNFNGIQDVAMTDPWKSPISVTIKTFGAVNEFIEGAFEGSFKDDKNVLHTVSGTFKAKRGK